MSQNRYLLPLVLVTSLFFFWAFLHNLNPILIPHLKKACQLTDTQSSFIDSSIYFGYFLMAIPAGIFMHRRGYKKGILAGLALFALGYFLFIPAASTRSYVFFLGSLFIVASGAAFLETVANPFVTLLGDKESSERRLNFSQSFNGLGAVIAPILGGQFILSGIEHSKEELQQMSANGQLNAYLQSEANTVKIPALIMGCVIVVVWLLFYFTRFPEVREPDEDAKAGEFSASVLRHSHLRWAVIAQFFYVGAQVGVGSFFVRFSKYVIGMPEKETAFRWGYIAMAGFMIGRFTGTFLMRYVQPAKLLSLYALINIVLLSIAVTAKGDVAVYAVMASPFFMSIMFPTIFALGIKELGEETKLASAFLVMSIIGGGLAPVAMGFISDKTGSMQVAYVVPLFCFFFVLYYGLRGHKIRGMRQVSV